MGRFALCIPDGSDGTRALLPCPDRRWQVAWTAGQTEPGLSVPGAPLEARASHREGGDGTPKRGRRPTVVPVRYMGPRNDGTRFLGRQGVEIKVVRLRTEGVVTGVLVYITGLGD